MKSPDPLINLVKKLALLGLLSVIAATVLSGCKESKEKTLPFETIAKDDTIRFCDELDLLIAASQDESQPLQLQAANSKYARSFTEVNFEETLLAIACLGVQGTSGGDITIDKVTQAGSRIAISITTIMPNAGTRIFTCPFHAITIRKADLAASGALVFEVVENGEVVLRREHSVP
jgi:hypothetical protein